MAMNEYLSSFKVASYQTKEGEEEVGTPDTPSPSFATAFGTPALVGPLDPSLPAPPCITTTDNALTTDPSLHYNN